MLYQSTSTICRWIITASGDIPRYMKAEVPGITPMAVGKRVRLTRLALGMAQQEFARRAGMTKQAMNNIELGRNFPTILNIVHLCEAHNLTMEWVCTGALKGLRHDLVEAIQAESVRQTATPLKKRAASGKSIVVIQPDKPDGV